jgi:ATP-binding protein involved in chromosome partitioning
MVSEKEVLSALSVIIDPDFKKDVVSLGFIKNVKIMDDVVSFDFELTTPACPIKTEFQMAAEKAVLALDGVEHVNVNMTAREQKQNHSVNGLKDVSNIIAVSSCKGGVGKSTVSAHLANDLAERGFKVGLLDADLFGPSVPTLFNVHQPKVFQDSDKMIHPHVMENGLKLLSFGFLMGDGPAIMRGPMVAGYTQQVLTQVAWGELDYLVIDMPPGTGDVQLTITQTLQITGAVIVTTRQSLALVDVERGIEMFEKVSVPMLGVVENMSYFICDGCDKRHYIFGNNEDNKIKERYGLDTLAEIPMSHSMTQRIEDVKDSSDMKKMTDSVVMALGKHSGKELERPEIMKDSSGFTLSWESGDEISLPFHRVRTACPCASCVDEFTGEKILDDASISPDIKAESITPLGNYAIKIVWSDGHSSGIFTYNLLKKLVY